MIKARLTPDVADTCICFAGARGLVGEEERNVRVNPLLYILLKHPSSPCVT
jgi:hypothetical protein